MTTSRRLADRKIAKFQKNITKRGSVPETAVKKGNDYPVGPIVLGFFVFVVIGSYNQDSYERWDGLKQMTDKTLAKIVIDGPNFNPMLNRYLKKF